MRRYIELVFDNSGSMNSPLGNSTRLEVAKQLFEKEVLPVIAEAGDVISLRLLRTDCHLESDPEKLPNDRNEILAKIKAIQAYQSTPLYYTVADAVNACRKHVATEKLVFIITDGDDTCGVNMESVISPNDMHWIKELNVLLLQFAVDDYITSNNLTAFGNYIGAHVAQVGTGGRTGFSVMQTDIRKALYKSGIAQSWPLEHCFEELEGKDLDWNQIENRKIDFHSATLLYHEGFLSWMPDRLKKVSRTAYLELKFLHGLRINSMLPKEMVASMLSQLQKPYYYTMDCIYWDFNLARWRYHKKPETLQIHYNPNAYRADRFIEDFFIEEGKYYYEDHIYMVDQIGFREPGNNFRLVEPFTDYSSKTKILRPGDTVKFLPRKGKGLRPFGGKLGRP